MTQMIEMPASSNGGHQLATVERSDRPLARHNPPVGHRGIQIHTFEDAWRMAVAISKSGMAPRSMETPEALFVAIEMGMEVGLSPMAAIRSIAVVNGRPAIYGDAALALVRASGLMEYIREWIDGAGDSRTAYCETKRKGSPAPRVTSFSWSDAKKASLTGKTGPWSQYPDRMLQFRARGFNLRDEYGDVLQGLYTVEEARDVEPDAQPAGAQKLASLNMRLGTARPVSEGQTFVPDDDMQQNAGGNGSSLSDAAPGEQDPRPQVSPLTEGQPAAGAAGGDDDEAAEIRSQLEAMSPDDFLKALREKAKGHGVSGKQVFEGGLFKYAQARNLGDIRRLEPGERGDLYAAVSRGTFDWQTGTAK